MKVLRWSGACGVDHVSGFALPVRVHPDRLPNHHICDRILNISDIVQLALPVRNGNIFTACFGIDEMEDRSPSSSNTAEKGENQKQAACLNCRKSKTRCLRNSGDIKCRKCSQAHAECIIPDYRVGKSAFHVLELLQDSNFWIVAPYPTLWIYHAIVLY